jgi:PEP-CTERM motif
MDRLVRSLLTAACVLAVPNLASAVPFTITGNATGSDATASGEVTLAGDVLTLDITNTSPFDARITGIGFDLIFGDFTANDSSGINGFTGDDVGGFTFSDDALGNVPQFPSSVLDFGWITGGDFRGGFPNAGLAPDGTTLSFTVTDTLDLFGGLTETQIADAIFVRFQRVGEDGEGSDVGTPGDVPDVVPEPATLLLFGLGLAGAAAVRRRL